jgi:flagellar basal-body rod modification protein FlgD
MDTGFVSATNTNAAASASISGTAANAGLDKNAFLRLLVTQLKNQDPTSTQDPNAMVQQLTSFSNLESLQNLGTLLQGIQVQNQGLFQAQVAGLVGKRIRVPGSGVELNGGKAAIGVNVGADAANVTLTIKDATGKVLRVLPQGSLKAGTTMVDWDGKDAQGAVLPDGDYTVEISATDAEGKAVTAQTTSYVKVDAVSFKNGVVYLVAAGRTFTLSDVSEIAA